MLHESLPEILRLTLIAVPRLVGRTILKKPSGNHGCQLNKCGISELEVDKTREDEKDEIIYRLKYDILHAQIIAD